MTKRNHRMPTEWYRFVSLLAITYVRIAISSRNRLLMMYFTIPSLKVLFYLYGEQCTYWYINIYLKEKTGISINLCMPIKTLQFFR